MSVSCHFVRWVMVHKGKWWDSIFSNEPCFTPSPVTFNYLCQLFMASKQGDERSQQSLTGFSTPRCHVVICPSRQHFRSALMCVNNAWWSKRSTGIRSTAQSVLWNGSSRVGGSPLSQYLSITNVVLSSHGKFCVDRLSNSDERQIPSPRRGQD